MQVLKLYNSVNFGILLEITVLRSIVEEPLLGEIRVRATVLYNFIVNVFHTIIIECLENGTPNRLKKGELRTIQQDNN